MTVLEIPTPDPRTFDDASRPFAEAVASRYAIKRLIGRGGMGIVYLARDRRLDRLVAIKTLPPQLAADESVRQRFLRETRTAGAMSHPNIVPIHGADEIDGHVFFVMGYVDGDSLAAHIRALGRLQPLEVAKHLRDVTAALAHAHGRGIIHRDIKAENILLERSSGRALVTDFGIARLAEAAPLTATGQMLGTVYYISPEQVSGDRIDARSDLYSLGVVGFFALTGRFPFDAELASAVLIAHVNKAAPPLRSINAAVPASLASIIDRLLAKDPAHRYETANDLLVALDSVIVELNRPALKLEKQSLISDTEAQAVWNRAAELQASTGIRPRPAPVPMTRDEATDRARTSGFGVEDVREAGREAGISTRYLEHALVERGLSRPTSPTRSPVRRSWWTGTPLEMTEQTEYDGELAPKHFDRLVNIMRDATEDVGTITANKRELGWRAVWFGKSIEASVVPVDGRTTVRFTQSIRGSATAVMASSILIGGFGFLFPMGTMLSAMMMHGTTPRWIYRMGIDLFVSRSDIRAIALSVGFGAALLAIPIGRAIVRSIYRRNAARLRTLAEAVSANVQLAIRDILP